MKRRPKPARLPPVTLLAGGLRQRRRTARRLSIYFADFAIRKPRVAYIGAANGDSRGFFEWIRAALIRAGAGPVDFARVCGASADLGTARRILRMADIVFLSGGDVETGMRHLRRCRLIPLLRSLRRRGKPFLGLSAGAIMLAKQWVRWPDPDDDLSAELFDCLGFAPVFCDVHGEQDNWEELATLLRLCPRGASAYGIPAGAGLRVWPNGRIEPLGAVERFTKTPSRLCRNKVRVGREV